MNLFFFILFSKVDVDIGRFKATDDYTLCEFYISIPYSELSYKKKENLFEANFKLRLTIKTAESQEVVHEFNRVSRIASYEEAEARNLRILDQIDLLFKPGKYEVQIKIISDSPKEISVEKILEIDHPSSDLYLSDIEFATSIEPADSGKFVKNKVRVMPHPQSVFGEKYPIIYTYTEIYNLTPNIEYEVNYYILDEAGDTLYKLQPKILSSAFQHVTEIGNVDISAFKEGTYILNVQVTQDNKSVTKGKKFTVIKVPKEEFEFTPEELKYYHLIEYIASKDEIDLYNSLPSEAKRLYLINFWKRAGKPILHTLIERVKYADKNFSSLGRHGRDSDRGRIWIRYGKPDEIEKISFDPVYRPCEKWEYFGKGRIIFIFVDKADDGKYELMYSSIPEELTAPDYIKWVNPDVLQ